jgi:hypothetical protein
MTTLARHISDVLIILQSSGTFCQEDFAADLAFWKLFFYTKNCGIIALGTLSRERNKNK